MHIEKVHAATPELLGAMRQLFPQLTTAATCPDMGQLEALVRGEPTNLLVVREPDETGKIVAMGCLVVYQVPTGIHGVIEDVVVDQSFRGRGIGQALVQGLLDLARAKGARRVALTSNPGRASANRLYLRMGFCPWRTNHYYYSLT